MANTAALLGTLLNTNADIAYYTQQQIYWSNKYEANAAKLQVQVQAEGNWSKAYDDVLYTDGSKEYKFGGVVYATKITSDCPDVTFPNFRDAQAAADAYAHAKVANYNEELSLELADLDMEYDTMKTMYDTLLENLRATRDSEKEVTASAAQETGLLQS